MVPPDWQHPTDEYKTARDRRPIYQPLYDGDGYDEQCAAWETMYAEKGLQETLDYLGDPPHLEDYMPEFPEGTATYYMMYETCSEGTPISPAFATPEELAHWLADTGASAFGDMTAPYEGWLAIARSGGVEAAVEVFK